MPVSIEINLHTFNLQAGTHSVETCRHVGP